MVYPKSRKRLRPSRRYGIWVWLWLGLFGLMTGLSITQTYAASTTREVKRTARNLHITSETLLQARQLLREVTDLALQLPTLPVDQMPVLASAWMRLNAPEAATQSERLFRALRTQSESAEPSETPALQLALAGIVQLLAYADPERAWTLFQQWPAVQETSQEPANEGDSSRLRSAGQARRQAQAAVIAALTICDPDRGTTLLQDLQREDPNALTEQGSMMGMLLYSNPELSVQMAKEAMKAYKDQPLTKENVNNHINSLQRLAWAEPDMVGPAARELAQQLKTAEPASISDRPLTLRSQETSIQLDGAEPLVLNLLRSLRMQPSVAIKLLADFPSLESKLNQIGGPDVIFRYGARSSSKDGRAEEDLTPPHKRKASDDSLSSPRNFPPMDGTCPKGSKRIEQWRRKLQELAAKESGFDRLIMEARNLSYNNPELAEEPLRLAQGLVDKTDSPTVKAERLVRLVEVYALLDNEIDSTLMEKAFAAVQEITETPAQEPTEEHKPARPPGFDRNAMLQMQIFSALARTDFQRALNRARTLPSDRLKLVAFMGILQSVFGDSVGAGGYFAGPSFR
jgi:hypothetical protein